MTGILIAVAVTFVLTVFLTLLVSALVSREKKIQHRIKPLFAVEDPQFERSMGGLLPPPINGGNKVTPLYNGDQIFPAMLAAVRAARKSICFETFIYWRGDVAGTFTDALCERAKVGVKVHVLLDWLGSKKMDQEYLRRMTDAGVDVQRYHPLKWYTAWRINHRT